MKKLVVFVLMLGLSLPACDSFLEEDPETFVSTQHFYRDRGEADAALTAVYNPLTSLYNASGLIRITDMAADISAAFSGPELVASDDNLVDPTYSAIRTFWNNSYEGVNRANAVIDNVQGADFEADEIVAEAQFLRGLYYSNLVRLFGGVPLFTSATTSLQGLQKARADEDEVYGQIIEDLQAAEASLPVTPRSEGRVTQGAAQALLAKVYLTRGNFQMARDKAKEVMTTGNYALWGQYEDAFTLANDNGKESIFAAQFVGPFQTGADNDIPSFTTPEALNDYVSGTTLFLHYATQELHDSYAPDDQRRDVNARTFMVVQGDSVTFRDPAHFKYLDQIFVSDDYSSTGVNFPVLRYADVLLTFAEAENEVNGGPTPAAYEAVNRIRRRAFGDDLDAPSPHDLPLGLGQAAFREAVWEEQFKEFPLEGHRWFDLKRTDRLVSVLGIEEHRRLYPIPQREVEVNDEIAQNPGY